MSELPETPCAPLDERLAITADQFRALCQKIQAEHKGKDAAFAENWAGLVLSVLKELGAGVSVTSVDEAHKIRNADFRGS